MEHSHERPKLPTSQVYGPPLYKESTQAARSKEVQTYKPNTWEAEDSLGYKVRPYLKELSK